MLIERQVDEGFVENQIRDEQAQEFEKVLGDYAGLDHTMQQRAHDLLSTVTHRYRCRAQSTSTPMSRFRVVSVSSDPMPLLARQALHNAGVFPGSLESVQLRTNASRPTAEEMEVDSTTADELEVDSTSNHGGFVGRPFRTARQTPQGNLARVEKRVKIMKRSKPVNVRVDKKTEIK